MNEYWRNFGTDPNVIRMERKSKIVNGKDKGKIELFKAVVEKEGKGYECIPPGIVKRSSHFKQYGYDGDKATRTKTENLSSDKWVVTMRLKKEK